MKRLWGEFVGWLTFWYYRWKQPDMTKGAIHKIGRLSWNPEGGWIISDWSIDVRGRSCDAGIYIGPGIETLKIAGYNLPEIATIIRRGRVN